MGYIGFRHNENKMKLLFKVWGLGCAQEGLGFMCRFRCWGCWAGECALKGVGTWMVGRIRLFGHMIYTLNPEP